LAGLPPVFRVSLCLQTKQGTNMTDETKKNEAGEQPITPVENKAENDRRRFL